MIKYRMTQEGTLGRVTSEFGELEPFRSSPHTGIDYACPINTEIMAPVDGIVSSVKNYGDTGLGKAVFVEMRDGKQYTLGHLSDIHVEEGQFVKTGELIASSGNTGNTTGPHLHFGAFDTRGTPIDPGEVPWSAFQEVTTQVVQKEAETGFVGRMADKTVETIWSPVGNMLLELLNKGAHALPWVFTAAGLFCFIITMAIADKKPYFWGIGCWSAGAIVKAMVSEYGF